LEFARYVLRSLGCAKEEHSLHGFCVSARTILHECLNANPDHIEAPLAHKVRDALGEGYNRTTHVPARTAMMQEWSDYIISSMAMGVGGTID